LACGFAYGSSAEFLSTVAVASRRIDATGAGRLHALDVLVLSTGFYPYKLDFEVTGECGAGLHEALEGSPEIYRTIAARGSPNFFMLFGPYSPIGNNSIIDNSEAQAGSVMQCVELIGRGIVRSVSPKASVTRDLKSEMARPILEEYDVVR